MAGLKSNDDLYAEADRDSQTEVVVDEEYVNSRLNDDRNNELFASTGATVSEPGNGAIDVSKQKIRSVMGGLTFQFADELEAYARSLVDDDIDYRTVKAEINKKVADYAKQNPKEAIGLELAGAVVPTIISLFGGPPAWSASVANIFRLGRTVFQSGNTFSKTSTAMTMAKSGTGAGVYSVGESENTDAASLAMDFGMGFMIGAPIAGSFVLGGNVLSGISTYLMHGAKRMGGTVTEIAVRKELNKLMTQTGKTEDEIIVDLMNGKLMTENQTMINLIKETIKGKGKAPDILKDIHQGKKATGDMDAIVSRPAKTRRDVLDSMQNDATGTKADKNLIEVWNASQGEIKKKEKELYDLVFKSKGGNPNLVKGNDNGMLMDILEAAQMKGSGVFEALEQIYGSSKHLVPLFTKNKAGVVRMLRQPSLEDIEVVRRTLSETAFEFNKAGKGQVGGNLQVLAETLRNKLDNFGEVGANLAAVRQNASNIRRAREAYDYGQGILSGAKGNSYEAVEAFMNQYKDIPGVMNALRIGVTQALKNQKDSAGLKDAANLDSRMHQIMKQILPEDKVDETMDLIETASDAAKISPQMGANYNSQTADKIQAANIAGRNTEGGMQLNPGAILGAAVSYFKRNGGMSNQQAEEYARLITTSPENYKVLEKALIDDSSMNLFNKLLDSMITGGSQVIGDVVAKEGAGEINTTFNAAESSGIPGLMGMITDRMGM